MFLKLSCIKSPFEYLIEVKALPSGQKISSKILERFMDGPIDSLTDCAAHNSRRLSVYTDAMWRAPLGACGAEAQIIQGLP